MSPQLRLKLAFENQIQSSLNLVVKVEELVRIAIFATATCNQAKDNQGIVL
ncbi:hypothetical protein VB713_02985 [Anabaena cylindrica UHCC 0172]|uniref:hypothetical protein n=1 Tax=Anabaena cylindrica TaxID=1165 RepID=UPI002B21CA10|nr:hypothetical protein [Anabaena cylindrica]MEA5549954.1 hypothetical protein [Anabaena cylindrica UHCC 0172]